MTATATPPASSALPMLTAADRCDRCGAQARVRVVLGAGDLVFCAHHAKAYEPTLKATAAEWVEAADSLDA